MRSISIALVTLVLFMSNPSNLLANINEARNFYQFSESVLTSGQPSATQLANAHNSGVKVVINLVPEYESVYNPNQENILANQGIEYFHVPVSWHNPSDNEFSAFLSAMDRVGDRKVLVHCWANARASALVTAHKVIRSKGTGTEELKQLDTIWSEVAGYDLVKNSKWQNFLRKSIASNQ